MKLYTLSDNDMSNHGTLSMNVTIDRMVAEGLISQEDGTKFKESHAVLVSSKTGLLREYWNRVMNKNSDPNDVLYVCAEIFKNK